MKESPNVFKGVIHPEAEKKNNFWGLCHHCGGMPRFAVVASSIPRYATRRWVRPCQKHVEIARPAVSESPLRVAMRTNLGSGSPGAFHRHHQD